MMNTAATQIHPYPPSGGGSATTSFDDSAEDDATAAFSLDWGVMFLLIISSSRVMMLDGIFDHEALRTRSPQKSTIRTMETRSTTYSIYSTLLYDYVRIKGTDHEMVTAARNEPSIVMS